LPLACKVTVWLNTGFRCNDGRLSHVALAACALPARGANRSNSASVPSERAMSLWKQQIDLDTVNGWNARTAAQALGIRVTEIGADYVRGILPVDERTRQPFGLLHGGASVLLAETLGSLAANLCLDPAKELAVGLDINATHLRAVQSGEVTGTAAPLHIGRTTQVWEIRIVTDTGELSCIARLTMAVVPRRERA